MSDSDMPRVPDFIKLKTIPVSYEMNVETDVLEPVVQREATTTGVGHCRFELQRKGFLHSQSKLFVGVKSSGVAADNEATYPMNIGVGSLVQRAVLKCGNQVLNEISDWQFLHMVKSSLISNETKLERELYTSGRCMAKQFRFGPGDEIFESSGQMLDNGNDLESVGANAERDLQAPFWARLGSAASDSAPVYSIEISDLFPFLKTHSLPLYLIDQPMTIELYWSPTLNDRIFNGNDGAAGTGTAPYLIDRNELSFVADYIFYNNEQMELYREQNPSIEFVFPDYRLSKLVASSAELGAGVIRNLGMSNRLVSRVLTMVTEEGTTAATQLAKSRASVVCKYTADAPARDGNGVVGGFRLNYRYNDRFEFPTDLVNYARAFSHFTQSESLPFVGRRDYSNQGGVSIDETLTANGANQSASINGKSLYLGTRLTSGRVGTRGIELHLTLGTTTALPANANHQYVVRNFCEYMRVAKLSDGGFNIFNA